MSGRIETASHRDKEFGLSLRGQHDWPLRPILRAKRRRRSVSIEAWRLALKYMTPVILLTDGVSNAGSIAPLSQGKGLILTDRLGNIRRIQSLLNELDSRSSVDRQMRAHTLMHASGAVVADLINKTFGEATAPKRTRYNEQKKSFDVLPPNPEGRRYAEPLRHGFQREDAFEQGCQFLLSRCRH